jgi:hypothetical protein
MTIQAKYESGTLSPEHVITYGLVTCGEMSAADGLAVIEGTLTLTDGVLTPTLRDTGPKTAHKRRDTKRDARPAGSPPV